MNKGSMEIDIEIYLKTFSIEDHKKSKDRVHYLFKNLQTGHFE